jgi:hypothetical protein
VQLTSADSVFLSKSPEGAPWGFTHETPSFLHGMIVGKWDQHGTMIAFCVWVKHGKMVIQWDDHAGLLERSWDISCG